MATGLEARAAATPVWILSERRRVAYVSARDIVVTPNGKMPSGKPKKNENAKGIYRYALQKFRRCNAGTCFNQKPVVKVGQKVKTGDVLADGPATCEGELALGKNLLVAFMPWSGYNFEDAIVVSERVVRDDVFTSIHIQDFEVGARDTKLGPEEITRDIPNVGEDALRNLGPDGVVRVGAEVRPGDILVGKITPKSETELAPEERLLRAIFGEKAADVRDTSLTVPSGVYGIVMDVKVTSQQEVRRPFLSLAASPEEKKEVRDVEAERKKKLAALEEDLTTALSNILLGEKIPLDVLDVETGDIIIPANRKITKTLLSRLAKAHDHIQIESSPVQQKIEEIINGFRPKFDELKEHRAATASLRTGWPYGRKRRHQAGAGLHREKKPSVGDAIAVTVTRVSCQGVPDCDMPFLPDGTPVDIVLNPPAPSRMNLGRSRPASASPVRSYFYAASPVFDGVKENQIDSRCAKRSVQEEDRQRMDLRGRQERRLRRPHG